MLDVHNRIHIDTHTLAQMMFCCLLSSSAIIFTVVIFLFFFFFMPHTWHHIAQWIHLWQTQHPGGFTQSSNCLRYQTSNRREINGYSHSKYIASCNAHTHTSYFLCVANNHQYSLRLNKFNLLYNRVPGFAHE